MPDLDLWFGGDLAVGPTGDLALIDDFLLVEQRLLRRLLTNAGDYLWQLNYGAGLGQFVGQPSVSLIITGITRAQMLLEASIAAIPPPMITVSSAVNGTVNLAIQYVDKTTSGTRSLSFSV